jgi:hypothetical protein
MCLSRDYAVFVDVIESPRCSKCGEMMALRIIEPERPGFDLRTFECPECLGTATLVASISCEVDVSIAPHVADARADKWFSTRRLFGQGLGISKFFLGMIVVALGSLVGLSAFVALTL